MANKYGVVETTLVKGCLNVSLVSDTDVENGMLLTKGELVTGQRQVYKGVAPATATLADEKVFLVANPAWSYDDCLSTNQNEENFINKAGVPFRAYELKADCKFRITDYSIDAIDDSTPLAVGQYVGLQDGTGRMKASASAPVGSAFVGIIENIDDAGFPFLIGSAGAPITGDSTNVYGKGTIDTRTKRVKIRVIANA